MDYMKPKFKILLIIIKLFLSLLEINFQLVIYVLQLIALILNVKQCEVFQMADFDASGEPFVIYLVKRHSNNLENDTIYITNTEHLILVLNQKLVLKFFSDSNCHTILRVFAFVNSCYLKIVH